MNHPEWLKTLPPELTQDSLWKMEAYRLALLAADFAWHDVTKLMQAPRTPGLASQLDEVIGSIGANLSKDYWRASANDPARFADYALGSARQSRPWYYDARHLLSEVGIDHRPRFLTQVIRFLSTMVPNRPGQVLQQGPSPYRADLSPAAQGVAADSDRSSLLTKVLRP